MKTWKYSLSTNTIWASFDYGEVKAYTKEAAILKAKIELKSKLNEVNNVLKTNLGHTHIGMNFDEVEVEQVKDNVAKLVRFNFVTRVVVPEDASDEDIVAAAKSNILIKVQNELHENLEEILDDIEMPVDAEEK